MQLEALFGNPNIEKILLFLLVNEKCYASQLSHYLRSSLTPIQQALLRLERGSILKSRLEGKTRLFSFDPHYPFLRELKALLKQAYQLLSLSEQQTYYCPQGNSRPARTKKSSKTSHVSEQRQQEALALLWDRLEKINHLSFFAESKADTQSGWNGTGKAKVEIKKLNADSLLFQEQGNWISDEGKEFDFKNTFRWSRQKVKSTLTLEHLRHGPDHPVILFELTPTSLDRFETVHPYLCKQDTYLAHLYCDRHFLQLNWRIIGPRKNEEIHYLYT